MAFLHHVAAFALVAALVVEFVLIRGELTPASARRLARADMIFGISAGALLVVGLARVFYFYPTVKFISWRKGIDPASVPAIRRIIHLELAGVVLIVLFAALMADGIGYLG